MHSKQQAHQQKKDDFYEDNSNDQLHKYIACLSSLNHRYLKKMGLTLTVLQHSLDYCDRVPETNTYEASVTCHVRIHVSAPINDHPNQRVSGNQALGCGHEDIGKTIETLIIFSRHWFMYSNAASCCHGASTKTSRARRCESCHEAVWSKFAATTCLIQ